MVQPIKAVQAKLRALGYDPGPVDGISGPKTKAALKSFQSMNGLVPDGIYGPKTDSKLFPVATPPHFENTFTPLYIGRAERLSYDQFKALAIKYGIEIAALKAVVEVEAAGSGFYTTNELKCLYEPHIAYKYSSGNERALLQAAGLAYPKWVPGKYPKRSFARIDAAAEIAGEELASLATSWGMGQIMGFNAKSLGYASATEMVRKFADSEVEQFDAMLKFISKSPSMLSALKRKDWDKFASLYNGPGYKDNKYDTKLATAYAKHSKGN